MAPIGIATGGGAEGLVLAAVLAATLAACTVTDLRTRLVPQAPLAVAAFACAVTWLAVDPAQLPVQAMWGGAAGGYLLLAALVRPEGMGMGDAKLAAVLGLFLGSAVVAALLLAFAAGVLAGAWLIARHGLDARRATIPFAPFLSAGALASLPI